MIEKLFKQKIKNSSDYFKKASINLFVLDVLVSCVFIFLGILLLIAFDTDYSLLFLLFPVIYTISVWLNTKQNYEISFWLYQVNSYLLISCLIFTFGIDSNFQLYYISISFSIFLYADEKKKHYNYLLIFYILSYVITTVLLLESTVYLKPGLKRFISLSNLILASAAVAVKAIKYVDLKEQAVEKYKSSHLKSLQTERLLKDKQAIFEFLFNSPIAGAELKIIDKTTNEVLSFQANDALLKLLKLDEEQLRNIERLNISPEYQSSGKKSIDLYKEIKELLFAKKRIQYKWDFIDSNGVVVHAEITEIHLQKHNSIINLVLFKDISTQKQAEKELYENELMYRTLFENVYDGIKIDIADKIKNKKLDCFINKKMLDLFKIDHYDIEVDEYLQFIPEFQSGGKSSFQFIQEIRKVFEEKGMVNFRMNLINGEQQAFTADFTAVEIESQHILKRILIAKDVTELEKKEQIIQEQLSSLEKKHQELQKYIESNKQLEIFASRASHDLKGPVITIGKFAQILKTINLNKLDEESIEYLNFIENSAGNLRSLIDDILEFSRISNQKLNIKCIKPNDVIQFVLDNLKYQIEACSAKVVVDCQPETIEADEIKFFTLIENLIENAINYRKQNVQPIIEISATTCENCFKFSITDNGIGIREENKAKIFEIYETLGEHNLASKKVMPKSTGIGLSTCTKVVELHKGEIWVTSVYGVGSTFSFTISKNLNQIINN